PSARLPLGPWKAQEQEPDLAAGKIPIACLGIRIGRSGARGGLGSSKASENDPQVQVGDQLSRRAVRGMLGPGRKGSRSPDCSGLRENRPRAGPQRRAVNAVRPDARPDPQACTWGSESDVLHAPRPPLAWDRPNWIPTLTLGITHRSVARVVGALNHRPVPS